MALSVCGGCGAAYPPDLAVCPQCGSEDCQPDWKWEEDMPKVTSGGVSNAAAGGLADDEVPEAPPVTALKSELVEHAVTVAGVDPDEAQAMTKAELAETIAAAVPPPPPPAS